MRLLIHQGCLGICCLSLSGSPAFPSPALLLYHEVQPLDYTLDAAEAGLRMVFPALRAWNHSGAHLQKGLFQTSSVSTGPLRPTSSFQLAQLTSRIALASPSPLVPSGITQAFGVRRNVLF